MDWKSLITTVVTSITGIVVAVLSVSFVRRKYRLECQKLELEIKILKMKSEREFIELQKAKESYNSNL